MIWVGSVGLAVLCILLAVAHLLVARRLARRLDGAGEFEGPARLELFGHVTHVGWVRQVGERIDLLTIEGEALQCDARARYRLTPLTWKALAEASARAVEMRKEELSERIGTKTADLDRDNQELWQRIRLLREAIAAAKGVIETWPSSCGENQPHAVANALEAALEADGESDDIPF